jgi:DNA invertase Pin-like site-specific DNA recombinase
MLGGLAEFERSLIRSRTGEGRARAKAAGVKFGRPFAMTAHQQREALSRLGAGETVKDVAAAYNVDMATVYRLRDREAAKQDALGGPLPVEAA